MEAWPVPRGQTSLHMALAGLHELVAFAEDLIGLGVAVTAAGLVARYRVRDRVEVARRRGHRRIGSRGIGCALQQAASREHREHR